MDSIGYAALFELDTKTFEQAARKYLYNTTVFILAPWKAIYATDDERKMTFEQALVFHDLIVAAYKKLNYISIEVPFDTIEARAQFLLDGISQLEKSAVN